MRRLLLPALLVGVLLAAAGPAPARTGAQAPIPRVTAFYYPWYGTQADDGAYQHWAQDGHAPPDNIASSYYPAEGLYSSATRASSPSR
jgi:hypothetical protein